MKYKLSNWIIDNNEQKVDKNLLEQKLNKSEFINKIKYNRDKYFENGFNIHNHTNYLLEYCVDEIYNKLWHDIDKIKIEINDLQNALTEFFDLIDEVVGKKLNRKSYYVFYKKLPNKSYTINWYYKISYEDNENLSRTLLEKSDKSIIASFIDKTTHIYHKNRAIQLPFNAKIISPKYELEKDIYGGLKSSDSNSHFFIYYDYNKLRTKQTNLNVEKYSIAYIGNCKEELTFTTDKIETEKHEQLQVYNIDIDYSNREKRLLDTDDIINELINNLNEKFYTAKYSRNWIGLLKLLKPLYLKDIEKYLLHSANNGDKLDYTNDRNKEFYNKLDNKADDKNFIIKKYKSIYTYICNYLNKYQEKYAYYTLEFSSIINDLSSWISNKISINKDNIIDILKEYANYANIDFKKINYIIKFTDEIRYNTLTSFLYKNNEIVGNYYIEEYYYKNFKEDDSWFDLVVDKLIIDKELNKEIKIKLDEFINYGFKTLIIEAKCATGKSHYILNNILEKVFDNNNNKSINDFLKDILDYKNINDNVSSFLKEVLFTEQDNHILQHLKQLKRQIIISPNNSLGKKEYQDFINKEGSCFITHEHILTINEYINNEEDYDKRKLLCIVKTIFTNYLNCITSLESIDKIKLIDYYSNDLDIDTMWFDEFDTIMNKWNIRSKTFKGKDVNNGDDIYIPKLEYNFEYFIKMCKKAKRIIILDAHINRNDLKVKNFLKLIGEENAYKIKIKYNKFIEEEYKLNIYDDTDILYDKVLKNVKLDEPKILELAFTSNNKAKDIFKSLICECYDDNINLIIKKHQRIGLVNSEGLYIYDTENISNCMLCDTLFINDDKNDDKEDIEQSNSVIKNQILDNKFNKIINNLQIKKVDNEAIHEKKQELLDDYEYIITEKYKFTTFMRTPTIECGISLNVCYFCMLYVFIYAGLFIVDKSYQGFWRSRNLKDKTIHVGCCNRKIIKYKEPFDIEFMKNHLNIITNVGKDNSSLINVKKIDKDEKNTYKNIRNKDLREYITINELEKLNGDKFFYQELFNILFYNGFRLDKEIKFMSGNIDDVDNDIIGNMETDRKQVNYENYKNTDIMELTNKQILRLEEISKNDNKSGISNVFRNKHSKYKLLTNIIRFEPLYQYFLLLNRYELLKILNNYNEDDNNEIIDIDFDNILSINKDHYDNYYKQINSDESITRYNLHNYINIVREICIQLKRLFKLINPKKEDDDKISKEPTEEEKIKLKKDKQLFTLLKFLGVDLLKDYNKRVVKRYVFDNSKKFQFITGFTNEVISNSNTLEIDGEDVCFLLWIQENLLYEYNFELQYKNKKTKLDPNKDMNLIKEIINHYLHKINLYFDYQYQHSHSSRNDKTLQFFINKRFDVRIVENEVKVNKFYFNNKKNDTENTEQYEKQITIMNNKHEEYINDIKNEYVLKHKNIHKPTKLNLHVVNGKVKVNIKILPTQQDINNNIIELTWIENKLQYNNKKLKLKQKDINFKKTLFFKDNIDNICFINKDSFINPCVKIIPQNCIQEEIIKIKKNRTAIKEKKYYYYECEDEEDMYDCRYTKKELEKEQYNSYNVNTKKDILIHLNSIKPNKLNFADLINQKVRAYNHNKDDNTNVKVKSDMKIEDGKVKLNLFTKREAIKQDRFILKKTDDKQKKLYLINNELNRSVNTTTNNNNKVEEIKNLLINIGLKLEDKLTMNNIHNKISVIDKIKNYKKIQPITLIQDEQKYMENLIEIVGY